MKENNTISFCLIFFFVIILLTLPFAKAEGGTMELTSSAFSDGAMIPVKYTCDGVDVSPPLNWGALPAGTKSLALICDDPDAPVGTWVHWVYYDIPADTEGLPEKVAPHEQPAEGGTQGINDFRKIGYGGPCPPMGRHRYFFRLYALDIMLDDLHNPTKDQLEKAMQGHILAEAELIGTYQK